MNEPGGLLLDVRREEATLVLRLDPAIFSKEAGDLSRALRYQFEGCACPEELQAHLETCIGKPLEWWTETWADDSVHQTFTADRGRREFEAEWERCERLEGDTLTTDDLEKRSAYWAREIDRVHDWLDDEKERSRRYRERIGAVETKIRQEKSVAGASGRSLRG